MEDIFSWLMFIMCRRYDMIFFVHLCLLPNKLTEDDKLASSEEGKREREMKIQCDICRQAEAELLCCADEAVLCKRCDEEVHAANKLSQKHQRLFLLKDSSSCSQLPLCDTCQVFSFSH